MVFSLWIFHIEWGCLNGPKLHRIKWSLMCILINKGFFRGSLLKTMTICRNHLNPKIRFELKVLVPLLKSDWWSHIQSLKVMIEVFNVELFIKYLNVWNHKKVASNPKNMADGTQLIPWCKLSTENFRGMSRTAVLYWNIIFYIKY